MVQSVLLSVPDIIDLAVGPPELNSGLLNIVLHIIASHIQVDGTRVQLGTSQPPQLGNQRTNFDARIKQFTVTGGGESELDLKTATLLPYPQKKPEPVKKLLVVDRPYPLMCTALPHRDIDLLEKCMPATSSLMELPCSDEGNTLVRMLDLLNLTKRLEATETTIEKLLQLLCESNNKNKDISSEMLDEKFKNQQDQIENLLTLLNKMNENMSAYDSKLQFCTENAPGVDWESRLRQLEEFAEKAPGLDWESRLKLLEETVTEVTAMANTALSNSIENAKSTEGSTNQQMQDALNEFKDQMSEMTALKASIDGFKNKVRQDICLLQDQVAEIDKSMNSLIKCSNHFRERLLDMANAHEEFQQNLSGLNVDVNMLVQERIDRRRQYEALIDQIELLKCVKADREEVEVQMTLKGDSLEKDAQNQGPYEDLMNIIQDMQNMNIEIVEKMCVNKNEWRQAVEGIYDVLEHKMDMEKADLMAKNMLDRMVALKDKLREFGMFRMSCDSTATSQKYLKDVKCLACNAQSYMKTEVGLPEIPRLGRFGEKLSEKTTHASKLFARITVPCCPNANIKGPKEVKRFCGGKHTITNASERTSVKGNFLLQTGAVPPVSNVDETLMMGTDGVLYHIDTAKCICRSK